jgi:hypothetical protein
VPVKALRTGYSPEGYWSKKALEETTELLHAFGKQSSSDGKEIPARIYNTWLNYAAKVGYAEREGALREEVEAVMAHLHNLSLAEQEIDNLKEENRQLREQTQELQKHAVFGEAVRRTLAYRIYCKFIRPFKRSGASKNH